MKRRILPLTKEEKYYQDLFIRKLFKETDFTLTQIGNVFRISKQAVARIVKKK